MIVIVRGASPATLVDAPSTGDLYNKPAVVHALWEMQHGKCCYCERKLPDKGHLKAVEHFAPKAIFKGLRNEWANLLLACSQCNGQKLDRFPVILSTHDQEDKVLYVTTPEPGVPAIINPSSVNPEAHLDFDFAGEEWRDKYGVMLARGESVLGVETLKTIGLHSQFYADLRWNHYSKVVVPHYTNLLQALRERNPLSIAAQRVAFENLMAPQTEFAGFVRAYARHKRLGEPGVDLTIPGS